jgi:hypothetical protein
MSIQLLSKHGSAKMMVSEHVSAGVVVPLKNRVDASNYRRKSTKCENINR